MASSTVYDAIKSHLVTNFGGTYAIRDWEEVETALQGGTEPWLALEDGGGEQALQSIGTPQQNWVEDTGLMDIHVFVTMTGGLVPARTIADAIRATFDFQYLTAPAGEQLRIISVSTPEPGIIHDGLWHSVIITVDYQHKYVRATAAE